MKGLYTVSLSKDGYYEVRLPWRSNYPLLPSNYQLSLSIFIGLVNHLKQDPPLLREYNIVIEDCDVGYTLNMCI